MNLYYKFLKFNCVLICLVSILLNNSEASQNSTKEIKEVDQRKKLEQIGNDVVQGQYFSIRSDMKEACKLIGKDGRYIVSTDFFLLRNVDEKIKAKIDRRKKAIKEIIWTTAADIEAKRNTGITFNGKEFNLSGQKTKQIELLNQAIQNNSISLRSLSIAIKGFVSTSTLLYENALTEKDPNTKSDLYIEYTAFAYELSSIVIELLENFSREGINDLNNLYNERKIEVDRLKGRINNMKEKNKRYLSEGLIDEQKYQSKIKGYDNYIEALDATLTGWQKIFVILDKQEAWAKKLKSKTRIFKDLRDEAGLQLDILAEVKTTMTILSNIKDIEEISEVAEVPLLPINANLVQDLLGLNVSLNIETKQ